MGEKEARYHLERAKKQLERVQTAICEPEDREEAVTWAFYAYENAVVAAAEKKGIKWVKTHPSKVEVAGKLNSLGILSVDVGTHIQHLNELRKDVQYGEPGEELEEMDLEDLASELENFINEVDSVISSNRSA